MIKFSLRCACESEFESWFPNGAAYEKQARSGLISCPRCGSTKIEKAPMSPAVVGSARERGTDPAAKATLPAREGAPMREKLLAMRREIEANTVDVGKNFAQEARDMHDGAKPETPIRGQATPQEARALLEDGIPVFPVPPTPDEMN
jgi:hypothetical protein